MKLFIDCRMLNSGGIGTYLESLLPYFTKNYTCILLINPNQNKFLPELKDNISIIETTIKTFSLKELFFFPKSIRKIINMCDIYYTPYCNIPCGIKIPIYSTIHDIIFLDIPELTSKPGVIGRRFFYQRAINKSNKVFTVSNFSVERIKEKLKVKNTPLVVTYSSVPEHFDLEKTSSEKKDNSIIYVGNIKKHKGLSYLLEAFNICKKNGLNCQLVIIGNAENFRSGDSDIAKQMQNQKEKDIIFSGRISDAELQKYYQKAKLLVQPSLYEGFGLPPLEALSLGTNVVISDIPVFKEIYKDFPVTFFKTGDSKDLAQKIIQTFDKTPPISIPNKYSFKNTAQIIMDSFNS